MLHREPVNIVQLAASRAPQVAALVRSVIEPLEYYNERARSEEIAKYGTEELIALATRDRFSVLVALSSGVESGFCISEYDDGLIWLDWFGVASAFRHRGIGNSLLRALEESTAARQCHKIWCDSRTSNLASEAVLARSGYSKICTVQNHWYGQDFFLWEKVI